jgi:hypothetical protein
MREIKIPKSKFISVLSHTEKDSNSLMIMIASMKPQKNIIKIPSGALIKHTNLFNI